MREYDILVTVQAPEGILAEDVAQTLAKLGTLQTGEGPAEVTSTQIIF